MFKALKLLYKALGHVFRALEHKTHNGVNKNLLGTKNIISAFSYYLFCHLKYFYYLCSPFERIAKKGKTSENIWGIDKIFIILYPRVLKQPEKDVHYFLDYILF